ncbi:MAG TPA: prolyl oligopeptidase family serine peptidase, partial [Candidatus Thermoplasmatota archaeon]|nr:prolyl oligopeptidase family serine peptidase [Candidatus Thermoplasmatota archaeon]
IVPGAPPPQPWPPAEAATPWPQEPGLHPVRLIVDGQVAEGLVAIPRAPARVLVVVCHHLESSAADYAELLLHLADHGAVAIAMDYRGPQDAFKVETGAQDTLAATMFAQQNLPRLDRTILYGYSLGGAVSGVAAARAPAGTYDYWISGSGVLDLSTLWAEHPPFQPRIEAETGGTPADVPEAYARRSPLAQVPTISSQGFTRVYLAYGPADIITPAEHHERMYHDLRAANVPVSLYLVATSEQPCSGPDCPPVLPGGHEVGAVPWLLPVLMERVRGEPETAALAERVLVESRTGQRIPLPA